MKIRLNSIDFEVTPVTETLRSVLLSDPTIQQGVWRDVWRWDQSAQAATTLVKTTPQRGVPLPNGLGFFVAKVGTGGAVVKNDTGSTRMAAKFLDAVGAKSLSDVIRAINTIVNLPQKSLPLQAFAPINPFVSYVMKMHVEYAVVQLRDAGRNLTAYLYLPGQVAFHHEITAMGDEAGYAALIAATPALAQIQPAFLVPPGSDANRGIRRMAAAKRIEELQPAVARLIEAGNSTTSDHLRRSFGRVVAEYKGLAPVKAAARV